MGISAPSYTFHQNTKRVILVIQIEIYIDISPDQYYRDQIVFEAKFLIYVIELTHGLKN